MLAIVGILSDGMSASAEESTKQGDKKADTGDSKRNPKPDVDNSGINKRDNDKKTSTADQQGNANSDVALTTAIRKQIVKDDTMSTSARNVKIVTQNGQVVLRGPVDSKAEKMAIGKIACAVAGTAHVKNEVEIKEK